ncbi:MAG: 8-amino-7-oxononanoate synthase [Planctomycetaceae bacterium]
MSSDRSSDRFAWLAAGLQKLSADGLRRERRLVVSLPEGRCEIAGRRLWNFASNDYLGLSHHPGVIEAARAALAEGVGAGASALVAGRGPWHERLEERIAAFEAQEAAVIFPTGYAANLGALTALAAPGDVVCCDRLNHASLVDAGRLSGARLRVYRHDRLDGLARELAKASAARRRFIVTDGLFSMDGDAAPLPELAELADQHDALLVVDEAHGTGVFGRDGRGIAEWQGVEQRVAVRVGTLSKAVGVLGGFVAGPRVLIDHLWNTARTQIYSTALPAALCAAACAAFDVIEQEPERRMHLLATAERFRNELVAAGLRIPPGCVGPIVPILLDDPRRAVRIAAELETQGFLTAAIRPPTVPRGTSRLRITLTAAHPGHAVAALAQAVIGLATD